MDFIKRVVAGAAGGFIGGAIVGAVEAGVVAIASDLSEYWAFLFGAISYGCLGALLGTGWGAATLVTGAVAKSLRTTPVVLGSAAALVCALLGLVVGRFRIIRDLFDESLPAASAAGVVVHVGLLVGAAVVFVLVATRLSRAAQRRGPFAVGIGWAFGVVAVAAAAAFALSAIASAPVDNTVERPTGSGPNVVLIIADTLRADHTSPYGATDVDTPALAALAADGVVFENAFVSSSWTRPSIATILTSMYPASHRVMHKTDLLPDDVVTLAESMRDAGYRTSGFVTNINVAPSFNFQQGFDSYRYLAPAFFFGATDSGSKLSLYSGMRLVRERFLSKSKYVENYYQDADTVNGSALPWLDANAKGPFFALIHYMDPHDPYFEIPYNGKAVARVESPNPDGSRAKELRDLYVANVEYLDRFVESVVRQLREAGVYDETVIAFTSDHGEEFYEHGGWWHGTTLYDEQLHVPLIIKGVGGDKAGSRVAELVGSVDIMPTLLASAGVGAPEAVQGRDLFADGTRPTALYAEEDHEGNVLESIRTDDWKLILANDGNPRGLAPIELYDLRADPAETRNLAQSKPDVVVRLQSDLESLRQIAGAAAVAGSTGALDAADEERLRALGYIDE